MASSYSFYELSNNYLGEKIVEMLSPIVLIVLPVESLFSKINDIDTSNIDINNNLVRISRWAYKWRMSFNPGINKQATEGYISQRREKS